MRIAAILFLLSFTACTRVIYVRNGDVEPREAPLTADQVSRMLDAGVSADVIRNKAKIVGVKKLSPENLKVLKDGGADDELLVFLIEKERQAPVIRSPRRAYVPYYGSSSYYRSSSFYYHSPYYSSRYYGHHHHGSHFGYGHSSGSGSRIRFGW